MKTRNELHWIEFEGGLWMLSDGKQLHCPIHQETFEGEGEAREFFECEHDKSRWHKLADAKLNCETYMVG